MKGHRSAHGDTISGGRDKCGVDGTVSESSGVAPSIAKAFSEMPIHVQEEELVLVHSFLNSQPRITVLPQGRAAYEEHEQKELHWIDRPRIDKLAAAGRLGVDNTQPQAVPLSAETGCPLPERPANSSYNALSRDCPASNKGAPLVGILKSGARKPDKRDRAAKLSTASSWPLSYTGGSGSEPAGLKAACTAGACAARAVPAFGNAQNGHGAWSQCADRAKVKDRVVVEDLCDTGPELRGKGEESHDSGRTPSEGAAWKGGRPAACTQEKQRVRPVQSCDTAYAMYTPVEGVARTAVGGAVDERLDRESKGGASAPTEEVSGTYLGRQDGSIEQGPGAARRRTSQAWSGVTKTQTRPAGLEQGTVAQGGRQGSDNMQRARRMPSGTRSSSVASDRQDVLTSSPREGQTLKESCHAEGLMRWLGPQGLPSTTTLESSDREASSAKEITIHSGNHLGCTRLSRKGDQSQEKQLRALARYSENEVSSPS